MAAEEVGPEWDEVARVVDSLLRQSKRAKKIICSRCGGVAYRHSHSYLIDRSVLISPDGTTHDLLSCTPRGLQRYYPRRFSTPAAASTAIRGDLTRRVECSKCHNDVLTLSANYEAVRMFLPDNPPVPPHRAMEYDGSPHAPVCLAQRRKAPSKGVVLSAVQAVIGMAGTLLVVREVIMNKDVILAALVRALQAAITFIQHP